MGTLVCKVILDKNKGVTVEVDNADSNITQKITMDGTTVTISVKGASETSTIVQKQDSIVITCKDFTLDTETITTKSKKTTSMTAQDTMTLKSTSDMTIESMKNLHEKATADVKIEGMNIKGSANANVEFSGIAGAKLAASAGEANVQGLTLALKGTTSAQLSGLSTQVQGTGMLMLEADGMATLKGSMTAIQGQLIALG